MFWSITLIVSVKYVGVVMRADNDGEGGVMALAALARRLYADRPARTTLLLGLGIVGLSLFYGDSLITPAISVLSAVEGLGVAAPGLHDAVLPAAVVILTCLFLVQRFGTGKVGRLFGPVTAVWLLAIAAAGLHEVILFPSVIRGLSPTYAAVFVGSPPGARLRRPRCGRAGDHRRRGAVRGHGPLRPHADPAGVVLPRVPRPHAQLPRARPRWCCTTGRR